jgi:hypothetical protein
MMGWVAATARVPPSDAGAGQAPDEVRPVPAIVTELMAPEARRLNLAVTGPVYRHLPNIGRSRRKPALGAVAFMDVMFGSVPVNEVYLTTIPASTRLFAEFERTQLAILLIGEASTVPIVAPTGFFAMVLFSDMPSVTVHDSFIPPAFIVTVPVAVARVTPFVMDAPVAAVALLTAALKAIVEMRPTITARIARESDMETFRISEITCVWCLQRRVVDAGCPLSLRCTTVTAHTQRRDGAESRS